MKNVTLKDIVGVTGGVFHGDPSALALPVTALVRDNREAAPGSLFAAFVGENNDGNDFIPAARAAGAVAALGTRPEKAGGLPYVEVADSGKALGDIGRWYRGKFKGPVIGISGSVGKTTAKEMIAAVLKQKFSVLMTEKNLNNDLGVPLTVCRLDDSIEVAVVEMGISDFGEMDYLAAISRPDIGVITNCGHAHLEALGDRRGVLRAKTEMMAHINDGGLALLNGDDDLLRAYEQPPTLDKQLFGTEGACDFLATDITDGPEGCSCRVNGCRLSSVYRGRHLVYSMLPAYAIGKRLGMTDRQIADEVQRGIQLAELPNAQDDCFFLGVVALAEKFPCVVIEMMTDQRDIAAVQNMRAGQHEQVGAVGKRIMCHIIVPPDRICYYYHTGKMRKMQEKTAISVTKRQKM